MKFKTLGSKIKNISLKFILLLLITSIIITNLLSLSPMIVNNIEDNKDFLQIGEKKIKVKYFKEFFNRKLSENQIKNNEKFDDIIDNETYFSILYSEYVQKFTKRVATEIYLNSMNIFVNDKNVKNYIQKYYQFQKNNKFDINKYKNYLRKYNLSEKEFEENIKKELAYIYFSKILLQSEFLLPKESKFSQALIAEKRYIKSIKFSLSKLINEQKCSKTEIINYLSNYNGENKENAPFPIEIYHMQYILINPNEIEVDKPSESELRDWYNKNEKKYYYPEIKDYSFIQSSDKNNIESIQEYLKKYPEDFEKFSQKEMLPNTCYQLSEIKDLHHIEKQNVPLFLEYLELNKVNQMSEIIDIFGVYYIFKFNGSKKSFKLNFEEVKDQISKEIISIKQKKQQSKWMEKIRRIPRDSSNYFEQIENITHQKIRDSKYFNVLDTPKDCNMLSLQRFLLSDEIMEENRQYYETKNPAFYKNHLLEDPEDENVYIIKLKGFKAFPYSLDPNQKDYDQEKMTQVISKIIKTQKAKKKIKQIFSKIVNQLNNSKNKNDKFKDIHLNFNGKEIEIFPNNITISKELVNLIFSTEISDENIPVYSYYIDNANNEYSLIKIVKIKRKKMSKEQIIEIKKNAKKNCEKILFISILNNLYSKYKVIYF